MSETAKNNTYEKLAPERKSLVDQVQNNLKNINGLWQQGWFVKAPESAITGKKYHGVNSFYLTMVSVARGYPDYRWLSYKQMIDKGWKFKVNELGESLGKGASVPIEFYELRDKETKKPFDRSVLDGMTKDEREEYIEKNVYPLRKTYRVFNGSLIDGIPELPKYVVDPNVINDRAESVIDYWDKNEACIMYGGNQAFYRSSTDEIHVPNRTDFFNMNEFYATVLHEMGHSTGHEKRLNRDINNEFGSEDYAIEELRAEIASLFLEQDLEIQVGEKHIENNSKYIKNWLDTISENPNVLFTAIADADKISKYIIEKEQAYTQEKNTEYFSVVETETDDGKPCFKIYGVMNYGQVRPLIEYSFKTMDELNAEFDKYKNAPFWKDKTFIETSYDELEKISIRRYEQEEALAGREGREPYIPPSVYAAREVKKPYFAVDMSDRGEETLRMVDRELVERATRIKGGEKFSQLYNGISILGDEEKDERSLMTRIAMFCDEDDKEQLMRVFKSSGQFRDSKPDAYYERMAIDALEFIKSINRAENKDVTTGHGKGRFGLNAKT